MRRYIGQISCFVPENRNAAFSIINANGGLRARDQEGRTWLHLSVHATNLLGFFLAEGLEVDEKTYAGETALHLAVRACWMDSAKLLIRSGADPLLRNARGETAKDIAGGRSRLFDARPLVEEIKAYKASDGKIFLSEEKCLEYEEECIEGAYWQGVLQNVSWMGQYDDDPAKAYRWIKKHTKGFKSR